MVHLALAHGDRPDDSPGKHQHEQHQRNNGVGRDAADIGKDAVVRSVAIGQVPAPLADNYEGAAVMRRDGRTFVWLVADDNFNAWQRSLLVEFELVDLPGSKKAAR